MKDLQQTHYEGPDPKTLGSFGEKVESARSYLESLNGKTRLEFSLQPTKEPWKYGNFSLAFNLDDKDSVISVQYNLGTNVFEGVLYGAGATSEIRTQFFYLLGFDPRKLQPSESTELVGRFNFRRLALVGK